jgi:hypothetical protein
MMDWRRSSEDGLPPLNKWALAYYNKQKLFWMIKLIGMFPDGQKKYKIKSLETANDLANPFNIIDHSVYGNDPDWWAIVSSPVEEEKLESKENIIVSRGDLLDI